MNSHDNGVAYALMTEEARQATHTRQIQIADVADAMANGFKAEPDLAPHHLPLLSDSALAMIYRESEAWRDKWKERDLEKRLALMTEAEHQMSGHYVSLREIIGALHVPPTFRPIDGKPQTIAWTEQKARELVAKAEASEKHESAARDAEQRVDLLGRYVKACDEKRLPYNWNVFKIGTKALRDLVCEHEGMEKLSRITDGVEKAAWFEERTKQEIDQDLRNANARIAELEGIIQRARDAFVCRNVTAHEMYQMLGAARDIDAGGEWFMWATDTMPQGLSDDTMVEVVTCSGTKISAQASAVNWSVVHEYRRVK